MLTHAPQTNVHFLEMPRLTMVHIHNTPEVDDGTDVENGNSRFIEDRTTTLLRSDSEVLSCTDGQSPLKCVVVGPLCDHLFESIHCTAGLSCLSRRAPRVYSMYGMQPTSGEYRFWLEEQKYRSLAELHAQYGNMRILGSTWAC